MFLKIHKTFKGRDSLATTHQSKLLPLCSSSNKGAFSHVNYKHVEKETRLLQVEISSHMCSCSDDGHKLKYLIVKSKFLLAEDQF